MEKEIYEIELNNGETLKFNKDELLEELVSYMFMIKDDEEVEDWFKETRGLIL